MQIGTKFSVAVHILLAVEVFKDERKVTSEFLAGSAGTNPVVIRKIMGLLKDAGLIEVAAGTGGIRLAREASAISLLDVLRAVGAIKESSLFRVHEDSAPRCLVGGRIEALLEAPLKDAQAAMEASLAGGSLADLVEELGRMRKRSAAARRDR